MGGRIAQAQRPSLWVGEKVKWKNSCVCGVGWGWGCGGGGWARWGALGSGHEKCGEKAAWRSRAKAELGTVWRGLSSNEALGLGHENCGEGTGLRSRAKPEV